MKLVSITMRRRWRRVGEVDPGIAAIWGQVVALALSRGADRYVLESPTCEAAEHPIEGGTDEEVELVQRGLDALSLNVFAGTNWLCSISDEGTAVAAELPDDVLKAVRTTADAAGLLWDED